MSTSYISLWQQDAVGLPAKVRVIEIRNESKCHKEVPEMPAVNHLTQIYCIVGAEGSMGEIPNTLIFAFQTSIIWGSWIGKVKILYQTKKRSMINSETT